MSAGAAVGDGPASGSGEVMPSAAASPSVGGGDDAATTPGDDRVVPQLGGLEPAMLHSRNGTPVEVTIVPQTTGKNAKRSWVWQVFHQFTPAINDKNVFCRACKHLLKWKSTTGTRGMSEHYKTHTKLYESIMKDHTTPADGRANIANAIGEFLSMCQLRVVQFALFCMCEYMYVRMYYMYLCSAVACLCFFFLC